ncbi:MAG: metal ABC transporter substrate-binding protein [Aquificaceae bacterium]
MIGIFLILFFTFNLSFAKDLLLSSTYPVYYPLSYMAGDKFSVDTLIKTQADPHHYELKPSDIRRLQSAKAFFYLGIEGWERKIARRLPKDKTYALNKNIDFIKVGKHSDPHLWMSPRAYAKLVENIRDALISLDPSSADHYRKRYEEFMKELKGLDEEYAKALSSCRNRILIITHLSVLYLGRDYRLEVVGLRGVHAEEEPKPSEIRNMIERARKAGVKYIFYEMGYDEKLVKTIANQVGAKIISINTSLFPEKEEDDYFSIMRRNLSRIAEGLNCP